MIDAGASAGRAREPRVTIVAMTVGYAMTPYVQLLSEAVGRHTPTSVIAPSHMNGDIAGVKVIRFHTGLSPKMALARSVNPWSHLDLLRKVRRTAPDVVHILNGHGYPWALSLATFLPRTAIVVTLHDPLPHPGNRTDAVNAILGRYTLSRGAAIHVHDKLFVPALAERFPGKPIVEIRHGSFATRYLNHRRPGISRQRSILFFGRVEYYKGIETLLRAALMLPPDIRVTIAGSGQLSLVERDLMGKLGDRVQLLNRFIEDEEAAVLLQQAGVLALPYRQATQSSLPLVAAAFDLPVVATTVGALHREVVELGGLAVPPDDPQTLAGALLRQLDSPGPIRNKQESFDDLAPKFLNLYRMVMP